jgi:glyoxylase-like metal-dependent hydrolase (beta-lactamase superfamily II)
MQVTPNVRAVQVPDDNPMHPQCTTIYLVGRGQTLTIDSGEDIDRYRWMLKGYLAATERAEISLSAVTHYHSDHSANLRWLRDEFGTEVYAFKATIPLLAERLPSSGVHALQPDAMIEVAGGLSLRTVYTPGHSADSVCYYLEDEGVLFTGDTVLGGTTTTVSDLGDYLASLERLRALPNLRLICPGHGPMIDEPIAWIDGYISHRNERERQIVALLSQNDALTSWQIMEALYTQIDPRLRRLAEGNVHSHLLKLEKEDRLRVHAGKRRYPSAEDVAREAAEEHVRAEVIHQADAYREEARQLTLAREEGPPSEEWLEPPRYELASA